MAHDTQPDAWRDFRGVQWRHSIDVRSFVQENYTPYDGDASFLTGPTERTTAVYGRLAAMLREERRRANYDVNATTPSRIISHGTGFIDQDRELIVGLQTDTPRISTYRKTHKVGVFDAYTPEIRRACKAHIVTSLPDAYGRGRIIGDYRRVALYGVHRLIAAKRAERHLLDAAHSTADIIRDREELAEQIRALGELAEMAAAYGADITRPAATAQEAIQWLYFGYLAAVEEQNRAVLSLGRTSTFLDIYVQRDLGAGVLTESRAQELVDDLVSKLRIIRCRRTPTYNELFAGDPTWVTESIGGMGEDGRSLVTRTSFRYVQTLYNLGPAPETNLTVLWSPHLPAGFKRYCAQVSIDTSSIRYENDELRRTSLGDDPAIMARVSAVQVGRQMRFFGARVNLAKTLLYAINGGVDEMSGEQIGPAEQAITSEYLDYDEVRARLDTMMDWLAETYVNALNCVHYMQDKYAYERVEMALHDYSTRRTMACGIAGLSVAADSLSAIKHTRVKVIRDENGLAVDYETAGSYPADGNNDDRAAAIRVDLVESFMTKVSMHPTYRNALHAPSVLTVSSNAADGKHTGNTPDGRRTGEPFAPGAHPMNDRDAHRLVAAALSVAKLPYETTQDDISLTESVSAGGLGRTSEERIGNLAGVLDGFTASSGFHLNVSVLNRATLLDAMEHPEHHPQLTIRASGYAVHFVRLTREQQLDVVNRTFPPSP